MEKRPWLHAPTTEPQISLFSGNPFPWQTGKNAVLLKKHARLWGKSKCAYLSKHQLENDFPIIRIESMSNGQARCVPVISALMKREEWRFKSSCGCSWKPAAGWAEEAASHGDAHFSSWETDTGDLCRAESSLVFIAGSRPARAT